jgi:hypothetical protein
MGKVPSGGERVFRRQRQQNGCLFSLLPQRIQDWLIKLIPPRTEVG